MQHVLAQQERFAQETKSTATLRELEQLRQELSTERELRENAEEKATMAEEALQKESVERFQAQMMAKERSHRANMQEVTSPILSSDILMKGPIRSSNSGM